MGRGFHPKLRPPGRMKLNPEGLDSRFEAVSRNLRSKTWKKLLSSFSFTRKLNLGIRILGGGCSTISQRYLCVSAFASTVVMAIQRRGETIR